MKHGRLVTVLAGLGIALTATVVLLGAPWRPLPMSKHQLEVASLSQDNAIFKGDAVKQTALKQHYVPFFGSSELSRMDAFHPSVLAMKYHRDYRPFLIGRAGSQSLVQYFQLQSVKHQLKNKRAVFIISPQWFTPEGQRKDAFNQYYSPLITTQWLLSAKPSRDTMLVAQRLRTMQAVKRHSVIDQSLTRLAKGLGLKNDQRLYLEVRERMLANEDKLFGRIDINDRLKHVKNVGRGLPAKYNLKELDALATTFGRAHTSNNKFGLANSFYKQRLAGKTIKRVHNRQTHVDYRFSPEYTDFELVLSEFARLHTQVLFVIPPVNQKWAAYTGLPVAKYRQAADKIKYQLKQQGFNHVADFSRDGAVPYFMQDTIHMGWRGWLKLDQSVKPFMAGQYRRPKTHIEPVFYTREWAFNALR